jgi:hypothetical protein
MNTSCGPARPAIGAIAAISIVSGSAALVACGGAYAANWEIAPRVEGGYRYYDNYRLSQPGAEIEVSGAEADAQLTLRTVDPRTNFEITPRINATYFPDERDEDSTGYYLDAAFSDLTPRRRIDVPFSFSQEDVVRSELPSPEEGGDLGQPAEADSGRVVQRNRRDLYHIAPSFSYDITQRYRLQLDAHYLRADFDKQFAGAQQDFSEAGGSAGIGFMTSPRSTVYVRGLVSQYETTTTTDAYGGAFEWTTDFSPTSRAYFMLGLQQTEPERGPSDSNFIGGIGGRWNTQRNAIFVDLTRSVGPAAAGTVVERHQLRLKLDHDISQRFVLSLGARGSRDEEIDNAGTYPTRKYAIGEVGLEWRWLRSLALTASYNYRWQDYADEPESRDGSSFLIGLVYEPRRPDRR